MPKKALIIVLSVVGIILIAGGVVGALWLTKSNQDTGTSDQFVEKDLGACVVSSRDSISSALTGVISTIGDGKNLGYAYDPDGETQKCSYDLATPATPANALTTTVTVLASADVKSDAIQRFKDAQSEVLTVGPVAGEYDYFDNVSVDASDELPAQHIYRFYVFKDMKRYAWELHQPAASDKFTATTAKAALVKIAQSATL